MLETIICTLIIFVMLSFVIWKLKPGYITEGFDNTGTFIMLLIYATISFAIYEILINLSEILMAIYQLIMRIVNNEAFPVILMLFLIAIVGTIVLNKAKKMKVVKG